MGRRLRKKSKQRKIIIMTMVGLLCIMSVGYAAFQTNLNINAKGNILGKDTITTTQLKAKAVTSGEGLYLDTAEEGRYIYKGANPNNHITFNNENWRIISAEQDGTLKLIRIEIFPSKMKWDAAGTRDSSTSTFCGYATDYGCHAWAATANLVGTPDVFTLYDPNGNPDSDTKTFSGTVTGDASLNTYLNSEYLGTIGEDSKYIVNHDFNVGTPGDDSDAESIVTDVGQEALYKWNGKVGLMNVTDVLRTTMSTTCTSLNSGYGSEKAGTCSTNNWLWPTTESEWTLSPRVGSRQSNVWYANAAGYISNHFANNYHAIRPVVYLSSDIKLEGEGTEENPYNLV